MTVAKQNEIIMFNIIIGTMKLHKSG